MSEDKAYRGQDEEAAAKGRRGRVAETRKWLCAFLLGGKLWNEERKVVASDEK